MYNTGIVLFSPLHLLLLKEAYSRTTSVYSCLLIDEYITQVCIDILEITLLYI